MKTITGINYYSSRGNGVNASPHLQSPKLCTQILNTINTNKAYRHMIAKILLSAMVKRDKTSNVTTDHG